MPKFRIVIRRARFVYSPYVLPALDARSDESASTCANPCISAEA
jgi:hypothetical protein